MNSADLIVIGGGLIGLASAYHFLLEYPDRSVTVLEKEADFGQHQSRHNAGVLHSGMFCAAQSAKARHVRYGKGMMRQFCEDEGVDYAIYGKVIVAIDSAELPQLDALYRQGKANGVDCELIDANRLRQIEPHCTGIAAIFVEDGGIVDYASVTRQLALRVEMMGATLRTHSKVVGVLERPEGVIVKTESDSFVGKHLINAAGLHADRVAQLMGLDLPSKVVPFRGEYFRLGEFASQLVNGQIFPVPNPDLPFTGIHLTKQLDGSVLCGPNAIMAGGREGYRKGQINLRDAVDQATSRRVRRLTRQNFSTALWEQRRSWRKELFAMTVQRLVPAISAEDLTRAPAGVSAYAVDANGELSADFVFSQTNRTSHVISAPTPGATASLSLGRMLASIRP